MINVNIGGMIEQESIELMRICKQYEECKECPMLTNKGLTIGNSHFICENLIKKGNEK